MAGGTSDDEAIGRSALTKASWRLLPLIGLGYGVAYMDRVNISFAALKMNQDLHFSASVYGFGAGLFFLSYAAMEVPSNLLLIRFGARRWIARIMLTWGLLAGSMMFVRTPMAFYALRFLLGAAEAGFFPGAVFYLMRWFPAEHRGRAISRFYVALPLSSVVMGGLAGTLLNLDGVLGMAGWQWLFIVEGLPAVILSLVILLCLPDGPAHASWLSDAEKAWIDRKLAAEAAALDLLLHHRLVDTLLDQRVWMLGVASMCILGANYAFTLSAPMILQGATHLSAANIGFVVAATGVLGAVAMLGNGWSSDRRRERHWHTAVPLAVAGFAYLTIGLAPSPLLVVLAFAVSIICGNAVQGAFWGIPSDALNGRGAAVGVAAIGAIGMLGSFIGPFAFGLTRDHTGSYAPGIMSLCLPLLIAAGLVVAVRRVAASALARRVIAAAVVS